MMSGSVDAANEGRIPEEFIGYEDEFDIAMREMEGMRQTGKIFMGLIRDGFYRSDDITNALIRSAIKVLGIEDANIIRLDFSTITDERRSNLEDVLKEKGDLLCINHLELMKKTELKLISTCDTNIIYTSTRPVMNSIVINIYRSTPEKVLNLMRKRDLARFETNDVRPLSDSGIVPLDNAETFLRRYGVPAPCSYEILKAVEKHRTVDNVCYTYPGYCLSNWRRVIEEHVEQEWIEGYLKRLRETLEGEKVSDSLLKVLCYAGEMFTESSIGMILEGIGESKTSTSDYIRILVAWGIIYRCPSDERDAGTRYSMSDYVRCVLRKHSTRTVEDLEGCIYHIHDNHLGEAYGDTKVLSSLMASYYEMAGREAFHPNRMFDILCELIDGGFFTYKNLDTGDSLKRIHGAMKALDSRNWAETDWSDDDNLRVRIKIISRYVSELVNGNDPSERTIVPLILDKTYGMIEEWRGKHPGELTLKDLEMFDDFASCQSEITVYTMDHLASGDSYFRFFGDLTSALVKGYGLGGSEPYLDDISFCDDEDDDKEIRDMLREYVFRYKGKRQIPVNYHLLKFLVDLFGVKGTKIPSIGKYSNEGWVKSKDIHNLYVLFEWLRQRCGVMKIEGCWNDHPLCKLFAELEDRFCDIKGKKLLVYPNTRTQDYARFIMTKYGTYNIMKNHRYINEKDSLSHLDVKWILDTVNSSEEREVVEGELSVQSAYQFVDNDTLYNVERALAGALNSPDFQCRALAYDCLGVSDAILGKIPEAVSSYQSAAYYYTLAGKTALSMLMTARAAQTSLLTGDVDLAINVRGKVRDYVINYEDDSPLMCRMIWECLKNCF